MYTSIHINSKSEAIEAISIPMGSRLLVVLVSLQNHTMKNIPATKIGINISPNKSPYIDSKWSFVKMKNRFTLSKKMSVNSAIARKIIMHLNGIQ